MKTNNLLSEVTDKHRPFWIQTCGECGTDFYQWNLELIALERTPGGEFLINDVLEKCERCQKALISQTWDNGEQRPQLGYELGSCSCGPWTVIDECMLTFLLETKKWKSPDLFPTKSISNETKLFCAYISDAFDWTEHGTSINSSWLTSVGETVVERLKGIVQYYRDRWGYATVEYFQGGEQ